MNKGLKGHLSIRREAALCHFCAVNSLFCLFFHKKQTNKSFAKPVVDLILCHFRAVGSFQPLYYNPFALQQSYVYY